ncbi:MAG: biopolymer transporter ExbD [Bacteroidaceae bacterium]|nr:biopolymer transporter ExbD [Bacteroidaceae bacterium]
MPGLNTTCTADISFILLVFFLMVTSMDQDKGLPRQLPKLEETKVEKITEIDKSNILEIRLTGDGRTMIEDEAVENKLIKERVVKFLTTCSQPKKHVLTLEVSDSAEYEHYFFLQNQLILAYRDTRETCAQKKYKTSFLNLNNEQKAKIRKMYPQRIAEKGPKQ